MKQQLETRNSKLGTPQAYLELARPANVVTAWADVLAGIAASGVLLSFSEWPMLAGPISEGPILESALLVVATTGLYAGGVVLNDVFDADLDAVERPERAIPSGRASRIGAAAFGTILLVLGAGSAWFVGQASGSLAILIAVAAVIYDRFSKHHAVLGPLNMGLCRGANLLLGVSILPAALPSLWFLGLLPVVYIAAITSISQSEVHGGSTRKGKLALALVFVVLAALAGLAVYIRLNVVSSLIFTALFAWMTLPAFSRAARSPEPANIQRAVKAGILGLIPLNATLAAIYASWPFGVIVLLLLPVSIGLARLFAVT